MKCEKCGTINPDGAKFCANCGVELKEEEKIYRCPKCNTEVKKGTKFCMNCGQELLWEDDKKVEEKVEENAPKRREAYPIIHRIIMGVLVCMAITLLAIGLGGEVFSSSYSTTSVSPFSYYFHDIFDAANNAQSRALKLILISYGILMINTYLAMVVVTFAIGIPLIVKTIKGMANGKDFSLKQASILNAIIALYLVSCYSGAAWSANYPSNYYQSYYEISTGWGTSLICIAFVFLSFAIMFDYFTKKDVTSGGRILSSRILGAFSTFFIMIAVLTLKEFISTNIDLYTVNLGAVYYMEYIARLTSYESSSKIFLFFALALLLVAFMMITFSVYYTHKSSKHSNKISSAFLSFSFILTSLLTLIIGSNIYFSNLTNGNLYGYFFKSGGGAISSMVFFLFAGITSIVSSALDKKEAK